MCVFREYASFGQLSDKVDVFSFGVLCLEVLSGQRNIDETVSLKEMYLPKWVSVSFSQLTELILILYLQMMIVKVNMADGLTTRALFLAELNV